MKKKLILLALLLIPIILLSTILIIDSLSRYNKYVVSSSKWNEITNNRIESNNISINTISFSDSSLLIDENNNILYYSLINSSKKYNPIIEYLSNSKTKLIINNKISKDKDINIMIYNDKYYHIYTLKITNLPMLNIDYKDINKGKWVELSLYDNRSNSFHKKLKIDGNIKYNNDLDEYYVSLKKESLGHNKRDNKISILGMDMSSEYIIKSTSSNENQREIELFVNNKYIGKYYIFYDTERSK